MIPVPSRRALAAGAACLAAACRGVPPADPSAAVSVMPIVEALLPAVERHAGATFAARPRAQVRDRDEARAFLLGQLARDFPAERARGLTAAYGLFGLLPDSVDLAQLALDLYAEQVAGYWDHERGVLVAVQGADPQQLRLVLAHELVHALQAQFIRIDSVLGDKRDADRLAAAQAVLEGQATVVGVLAVLPDSLDVDEGFWETYREQVVAAREASAALRAAPRVLRVGLLFPYLEGAEWVRWWRRTHGVARQPFGADLPESTEQILFPERLAAGDRPVAVTLEGPAAPAHTDVLGEFEVRVLVEELTGRPMVERARPLGWGGDRYGVWDTERGPALVWVSVWDDARSRDGFVALAGEALRTRRRPGYAAALDTLTLDGRPAVRWTFAPEGLAPAVRARAP